jgi:hypothetical protein
MPVGIVTTNYDLIPEYALGTREFNYGEAGEQIGYTPYPHPAPVYALALLWQIYSRRFSAPIQDWQYGHRRGFDRMTRSTMAWRTAGNVG